MTLECGSECLHCCVSFCRFRTVRARLLFTRRLALGAWTALVPWWLTGLKSSKHLHLFMPNKHVVRGAVLETGLEQAQVLSFVFNISNIVLLFRSVGSSKQVVVWVTLTTSRRGLDHSSLGILGMRERVSERGY